MLVLGLFTFLVGAIGILFNQFNQEGMDLDVYSKDALGIGFGVLVHCVVVILSRLSFFILVCLILDLE